MNMMLKLEDEKIKILALNERSNQKIKPAQDLLIQTAMFGQIVEALFATARGHNVGLENESEPNKPSCNEGLYARLSEAFPVALGTPGEIVYGLVLNMTCN